MAPLEPTPSVDHLALAREDLAIAESADSKREAYKRAAEHVAAHIAETGETQVLVATKMKRREDEVSRLLRWRKLGYPEGTTPFTMAGLSGSKPTDRAATSHTRKVLRERPEDVADAVADAVITNPVVRKVVEKRLTEPSPALRQAQQDNRDDRSPAQRKADEAETDATAAPLRKALASFRSPSAYIVSAIEEIEAIEGLGGRIKDLEFCVEKYKELGNALWRHGAMMGMDVSAIAAALKQWEEDGE